MSVKSKYVSHKQTVPHQIDECEEYDDDGGDGALGDGMVHVRDDAGDGLSEAGGAQRVPDRLRQDRRQPRLGVEVGRDKSRLIAGYDSKPQRLAYFWPHFHFIDCVCWQHT